MPSFRVNAKSDFVFNKKTPALERCAPNGLDATRHMKQQLLQYSTGTKTRCVVTPNQQRCSPNAHNDMTEKDVAAEVPIRLPILCTTSLQTTDLRLTQQNPDNSSDLMMCSIIKPHMYI